MNKAKMNNLYMDARVENFLKVIVDSLKDDDSWGVPEFENAIFKIAPYSWRECICEDDWDCTCPDDDGGFLYKPTGWHCNWYKHIGRGMNYGSVTEKELLIMLRHCINSPLRGEG